MKIVLIQPPVEDFYDTDIRLQPLGLCYLKAALLNYCQGVSVTVCDFHHGWGRKTISIPAELRYLKDFYDRPNQSPFSSFHQYYHFGADYKILADEIQRLSPDLVGISSLFTPYYREVFACAEAIKAKSSVPIAVGGGHASCCPERMLQNSSLDFVVVGQGEKPFIKLVQALKAKGDISTIPGLGFKEEGQCKINPGEDPFPFNELPFPDFSDLSVDGYQYQGQPIAFIQSSRGCPYKCSFCSVHKVFGRKYDRRSSTRIVQEMKERFNRGYRVFDFEDDNLTFDQKEFVDLCKAIQESFDSGQVKLLAMNGVSYQNMNDELLCHMKLAGFVRLNLALVSADQSLLRSIGRPHHVEGLSGVVNKAYELGFDLEVHMILGLPGDSVEEMVRTMRLLAELPVLIGVSIFYLTPGADIATEFGEQSDTDMFLARSTAMAIESESCSRKDLFTLFVTARIINFIKGFEEDLSSSYTGFLNDASCLSKRQKLGVQLFKRLLSEQKLYGYNGTDSFEIKKFDYALFEKVWNQLDYIQTQQGVVVSREKL